MDELEQVSHKDGVEQVPHKVEVEQVPHKDGVEKMPHNELVQIRQRVEQRVEGMIGFYKHLGGYMVINLLLFCVWLWQNYGQEPTFPWFVFPLGGWGVGILFHFLNTFVWDNFDDWKKKKVKELMDKETGNNV